MSGVVIHTDQAIAALKDLSRKISPGVLKYELADQLNATMKYARKAANQEISRVYAINDPSYVTSKLRGTNAKPGDLEAKLYADNLGIQLGKFAPSQALGDKSRRLSVEVLRGERQTLKSAFFTKARAGAGNEISSVFARGRYQGREFEFRQRREAKWPKPDSPIGLLRTTSPFSMLGHQSVKDTIDQAVDKHFAINLERRLKRLLSR